MACKTSHQFSKSLKEILKQSFKKFNPTVAVSVYVLNSTQHDAD